MCIISSFCCGKLILFLVMTPLRRRCSPFTKIPSANSSSSKSEDVLDDGGVSVFEDEGDDDVALSSSTVIELRNKSSLAMKAPLQSILMVPGSADCKSKSSCDTLSLCLRWILSDDGETVGGNDGVEA